MDTTTTPDGALQADGLEPLQPAAAIPEPAVVRTPPAPAASDVSYALPRQERRRPGAAVPAIAISLGVLAGGVALAVIELL